MGVISALKDADEFAVSSAGEAAELRGYTDKPVNILSAPDKTAEASYSDDVFPAVCTVSDVEFVKNHGARKVNVKVNTGMNRYGADEVGLEELLKAIEGAGMSVKDVFSHVYDISAAEEQFERFMSAARYLEGYFEQKHILSSNFLRLPEYMHLDMVRPGLVLYGYGDPRVSSAVKATCGVTQVRKVTADDNVGYGKVLSGRAREIAVLGVGYGDGYRRTTAGESRFVSIRGNLCPIVGQICMDACMADVSGIGAEVGEEACIIGADYGVEALAAAEGTIAYEILTGLSKRVERQYIKE